jgi:hypothetical protein
MKRSARGSHGLAKRAGSKIRNASMRWTSGIVLGRLGDSMRSLSSGLSYHLSVIAFERGDARDSSAVFFLP